MLNLQLKLDELKNLSREELLDFSTELGKDKSFMNRRLLQEASKQIKCPHDRETFLQNFDFYARLEMMDEEFLENLKPL